MSVEELAQSEEATALEQTGLETQEEQAQALPEGGEQPTDGDSSQTEQPGAESAEVTQDFKKDYGELQPKFTEVSQQNAKMKEAIQLIQQQSAQFGGIDQMFQWAQGVQANPNYQQFLKQQQYEAAGITGPVDDETRQAFDTVQSIASQSAKQQVQELLKKHIEPVINHQRRETINSHFDKMDSAEPGWKEMLPQMINSAGGMALNKQENPTFKDVQDLYIRTLQDAGKFDEYVVKKYNSILAIKKKLSTPKPAPASNGTGKKQFSNLRDAFANALQDVGGTLEL